tara:strand:- start:1598 stop:1993 length:396 start_codon:yes stop_codon:yes gene_type:complete
MATHDYNIANQTGVNLRADLNNVLNAILTNNSGSSAPSTTSAYMLWYDTTNHMLKIRNGSNNAWIVIADLVDGASAPKFQGNDGSVTEPTFSNSGDTNTGMYFSGADEVSIATGGNQTIKITSGTLEIGGS